MLKRASDWTYTGSHLRATYATASAYASLNVTQLPWSNATMIRAPRSAGTELRSHQLRCPPSDILSESFRHK